MAEGRYNNSTRALIDLSKEYARGAFKIVYEGTYTEGDRRGESCVCKQFISGSVYEDSYFEHELDVVKKATNIVSQFNRTNCIDKIVKINQPEIWVEDNDEERCLIEPMIDNFEKFNSNSGWSRNAAGWAQAMQALTHFSYHCSNGQFTLCDLQGGVYSNGIVLTDPVVMSTDQRYGPTDLGSDGIDNFFYRHVCGQYCKSGWKRPSQPRPAFHPIKGTTMLRVNTRHDRAPLSRN
ncbi:hypothetical protein BGZ76_009498 [Entomortierella beljakovae]|nr:hypothetical protein BGZ76_009498 [Entomortierella beljakovae]